MSNLVTVVLAVGLAFPAKLVGAATGLAFALGPTVLVAEAIG